MTYDFTGKVAVVTGAGSGIGRAVAVGLAKDHAKVALVDIDEGKAKATQQMIAKNGGASSIFQADLCKLSVINKTVNDIVRQLGGIDILVNAAAIYPGSSVADVTEEFWDKMMDLDLKAVFFTCQAALRHMTARKKGAIVNIASGAAHYAMRDTVVYSTAKGGILAMSRCLALEAGPSGVRVNVISPGPTDTEGVRAKWESQEKAGVQPPFTATLLGRRLTAEEIAAAIIWACSEAASGVMGATINVNGGNFMP